MSQANTQQPILGAVSLVVATFFWSSFAVLVRMIGFDLPVFFAAWSRNMLGGLLILIPLILLKQFKSVRKQDLKWLFGRSLAGVFGFTGSFYGFYYLPVGTAYFLHFGSATVMAFILGKLLFQEQLTRIKILSLVLAGLGVALVYGVTINPSQSLWIWMTLGSGIGSALWSVLPKKISTTYSHWQINGLDFLIFSLLTLMISYFNQDAWSLPALTMPWLANLLFLAMAVITGQLVIVGFKHLDAQRGSLIMLLEIVFGLLLGVVVFREQLSSFAWLGGALIVAAAALPELVELRKQRTLKGAA